MNRCNPVGAIPTVDGARPALMTPLMGVARLKVMVDLQGQPLGDGGASPHGDHDGGGDVGQRLYAGVKQSNR
jgi:hypothetical protein